MKHDTSAQLTALIKKLRQDRAEHVVAITAIDAVLDTVGIATEAAPGKRGPGRPRSSKKKTSKKKAGKKASQKKSGKKKARKGRGLKKGGSRVRGEPVGVPGEMRPVGLFPVPLHER
jgi:hypothetical protein